MSVVMLSDRRTVIKGERVRMGKRDRALARVDGAKRPRRRFTAEYKLRMVEEANACRRPGDIGRLLKREGLHSSQLSAWRRAARQGMVDALGRKRGRKPLMTSAEAKRIEQLERSGKRMRKKLWECRMVLEEHRRVLGDRAVDPDELSWPEGLMDEWYGPDPMETDVCQGDDEGVDRG